MPDDAMLGDIRQFIIERFLVGEEPDRLTPTTRLISSGVLDSLGTLELVQHLEETYGIEFAAHELDRDRLDTLEGIARLVREKQSAGE